MPINVQSTNFNFHALLDEALRMGRAEPNAMTIVLQNREQLRVFADVRLGLDAIQFRPESAAHKSIVVPFASILKVEL